LCRRVTNRAETKIRNRLATDLKPETLDKMEKIVSLDEIAAYMDEILEGETIGRVVAKMTYTKRGAAKAPLLANQ